MFPNYRVSIYASVDVEAIDEKDAEDKAAQLIINGELKIRDYELSLIHI